MNKRLNSSHPRGRASRPQLTPYGRRLVLLILAALVAGTWFYVQVTNGNWQQRKESREVSDVQGG